MNSQKRELVFLFLKYGLFSLACFFLGTLGSVALQDAGIFAGNADAAINFVRVNWSVRPYVQAGLSILVLSGLGLGLISILNRSERTPIAIVQALAFVPLVLVGGLVVSTISNRQWDIVVLTSSMAFLGGGVVLSLTHQIKRARPARKVILASVGAFVAVMIGGLVMVQPKKLPFPKYYSSAHNTSSKVLESVLDKAQVQTIVKALDNPYIKHWVRGETPWILVDEAFSQAVSYEYRDGYWRLSVNVNFAQKDVMDLKCTVGASRAGSMWKASGGFDKGMVTCRNDAMFFKTDLNGKLIRASTKFLNREVVEGLSLFFKSSYEHAKKQVVADSVFLKWAGAIERVDMAKKSFYLGQLSQYRFREKGMLASLDIKTNTRDLRCLVGVEGAVQMVNKNAKRVGEPVVWCVDRLGGQMWQRLGKSIERGHMLNTQSLPEGWAVEAARTKLVTAPGLKKLIGAEYAENVKLVEHDDYRGALIETWAFHRVMEISDTQTVQMLLFAVHIDNPLMCAVFVPQRGALPQRVRMLGVKDPHTTMTTCWSATHQHQFFENGTFYRSLSLEKFYKKQPIIAQNRKKN